MKQNEIEKSTGPSAPASPAATRFNPYVTTYNNKPALVWRNEKGILSLVTADRQKVGTNKQLPVVKNLEVIDGKKSRYAVTKMGYLDLANGNFVDAKTAAAIDAFRNPAPAPTPALTPAPKAPTFSWKDWWKLKGYRCWAHTYYGTDAGDGLRDEAFGVFTSLGEDCLKELNTNVSDLTLDCDSEVDDVAAALRKYSTFTQNFKSDLDLLCSAPSCFDGIIEEVNWRTLTVDFPLTWEVRAGDAELTHNRTSIYLDPDCGYLIGISPEGWILFAKEEYDPFIKERELVVVAKTHIQRMVLDRDDEGYIQAAQEVVESLVQELYGYHPDQLTLF